MAKSVAQSYLESRAKLGFPMAPKTWADDFMAKETTA
jgi:glycyl-tRNA synthetase alpha chain